MHVYFTRYVPVTANPQFGQRVLSQGTVYSHDNMKGLVYN